MFTRENGKVQITLSGEEYNSLLLMTGYAAGAAESGGHEGIRNSWLKLANAINEGNPDWTPYEIPVAVEKSQPDQAGNQNEAK